MKSASSLTTACHLFLPLERRYFQHFSVLSEHNGRLPLHQIFWQHCCAPRACTKIPGNSVASLPDTGIQVWAGPLSSCHISRFYLFLKVRSCPPPSDPSRSFHNCLFLLWPLVNYSVNYFYVTYFQLSCYPCFWYISLRPGHWFIIQYLTHRRFSGNIQWRTHKVPTAFTPKNY